MKKLFQICPTACNSTVDFDELVRAASEIAVAKENCLESANTSACGVSGNSGEKSKKKHCGNGGTKNHNEAGFSEDARKKHYKAHIVECGKCQEKNTILPMHARLGTGSRRRTIKDQNKCCRLSGYCGRKHISCFCHPAKPGVLLYVKTKLID